MLLSDSQRQGTADERFVTTVRRPRAPLATPVHGVEAEGNHRNFG